MIRASWFIKWLKYSYSLHTFWNKTLGEVKLLYSNSSGFVLFAEWPKGRRSRGGLFIFYEDNLRKFIRRWLDYAAELGFDLILMTREESCFPSDAQSMFFIWCLKEASFLKPSQDVEVRVLDYGEAVDIVRRVTRESWGFSISPRRELHLVLSAWLGGKPVGVAMLNKYNFNIDFGVHVVRGYWKRRIGTRLLYEAAVLAEGLGAEYLTVVRVLRGSSADRRALGFYKANKPSLVLRVQRLACSSV